MSRMPGGSWGGLMLMKGLGEEEEEVGKKGEKWEDKVKIP